MVNGTSIVFVVSRWEISANLLHFKKILLEVARDATTLLFPLPEVLTIV